MCAHRFGSLCGIKVLPFSGVRHDHCRHHQQAENNRLSSSLSPLIVANPRGFRHTGASQPPVCCPVFVPIVLRYVHSVPTTTLSRHPRSLQAKCGQCNITRGQLCSLALPFSLTREARYLLPNTGVRLAVRTTYAVTNSRIGEPLSKSVCSWRHN